VCKRLSADIFSKLLQERVLNFIYSKTSEIRNGDNMIVLFDMDGTLTPPRKEITHEVVRVLKKLQRYSRIGIISGSDTDYINQQCKRLFEIGGVDPSKLDILPCNGTKLYKWKHTNYSLIESVDMREKIGKTAYRHIISKILNLQSSIVTLYPALPFTGTFVQYRGSLLNWCPIGREANFSERDDWKKNDKEFAIREAYSEELEKFIKDKGIDVTVALGGTTSFDVYPTGWDKTFGLTHYPEQPAYFIGDRCEKGGNDWHIYKSLEKHDRAWKTSGPEETIHLVEKLIEKLRD
tara:strand:- start:3577 stop:4455 length:879 start_codon:yes stop_codon:yes gene_type:complete